jgi:hypothetical protein
MISISLFGANGGVHQSAALTNVRALSLEHAAGSWRMQIKGSIAESSRSIEKR